MNEKPLVSHRRRNPPATPTNNICTPLAAKLERLPIAENAVMCELLRTTPLEDEVSQDQ